MGQLSYTPFDGDGVENEMVMVAILVHYRYVHLIY